MRRIKAIGVISIMMAASMLSACAGNQPEPAPLLPITLQRIELNPPPFPTLPPIPSDELQCLNTETFISLGQREEALVSHIAELTAQVCSTREDRCNAE